MLIEVVTRHQTCIRDRSGSQTLDRLYKVINSNFNFFIYKSIQTLLLFFFEIKSMVYYETELGAGKVIYSWATNERICEGISSIQTKSAKEKAILTRRFATMFSVLLV